MTAVAMINRAMNPPIMRFRFRRTLRKFSASLFPTPNPGVNNPVGDIHEEVHHDDDEGDQKAHSLNHRQVPLPDGQENQSSQTRQVEDIFDDDRPRQELAICKPRIVITGIRALRKPCLYTTTFSASPLALAVRI